MSHPAIIPIQHENPETGKPEFDGTGFITEIEGKQVFVTCSHTFRNWENDDSFIIVEGTRYELSGPSWYEKKWSWDTLIFVDDPQFGRSCKIPDYAFYVFPSKVVEEPLELCASSGSIDDEELRLMTHCPDSGSFKVITCTRAPGKCAAQRICGQQTKVLNMLQLFCRDRKKGYSGGPILDKTRNCRIGFLSAGDVEAESTTPEDLRTISVIKSETIIENYYNLKH